MRLSYVLISFNRRQTLLQTVQRLCDCTPLDAEDWDIWVVDNASTDGSAEAVAHKFGNRVNVIRNHSNEGMYARNHAFSRCKGNYVISLDDDSYPADARAVKLVIEHMDANPMAGALVAKVVLPDGSCEAPALPTVIMGGASCLRKSVLDQIGGFRKEFFRQAEEYDFSFRIWRAGFRVERREDIIFRHEKVGSATGNTGRDSVLVRQLDLRNNLIIAQRFLPAKFRKIYWQDWRQRYEALARQAKSRKAIFKAIASARAWGLKESVRGRLPLSEDNLEQVFGFNQQSQAVGEWARRNSVWRVVLADFGKNIWATYNACRASGLQLRCIADENPAFENLEYRGLPIVPARRAFEGGGIDGVVVANINPAQVDARAQTIGRYFSGPILRLWQAPLSATQTRAAAVAA
jgi:GT2 family glycosyltransferase